MSLTTQQEKAPEQRGRYRLPIEALEDGKKLRSQIMSMNTAFDAAYLFAETSLIPGLGSLVLMTKKIWESSEKVGAYKEAFQQIRQELSNFCYLLTDNQNLIDSNSDFMQALHSFATIVEDETEEFAKWGFWKTDIRVARSSSEIHALEEKIYEIRMDPAIDISSLPADLSREVKCTKERAIYGTQYVVKQGKWLNRDIVAMKWPKDFGPLACSAGCGGTPETCFEQTRHVPAAKAMEIRDIALGLQYIHSKGVAHSALSPKNVLIQPDGTAVIGDFSRAKIIPPESGFSHITDMSDECTFMRYQAPEEQRSPRPMSPEGDIFAWSMVSLEIISRVEPYATLRVSTLIYERTLLEKRLPTLEEHPSALWEICPGLWELLRSCQNHERLQRPKLDHIIGKLDEYIEKEEKDS
ncbi:hypothetical protein FRC01_006093 [Tulasnella sp. 417]|nr:hypothetical protein FRC01_006093 [Tulasnella sp. 417]